MANLVKAGRPLGPSLVRCARCQRHEALNASAHVQPNALRAEDFREMYEENFLGILGKDRRWGLRCVLTLRAPWLPSC